MYLHIYFKIMIDHNAVKPTHPALQVKQCYLRILLDQGEIFILQYTSSFLFQVTLLQDVAEVLSRH